MPAVVKTGNSMIAKNYQENISKLKHAGLMTIAFAEPCKVEGTPLSSCAEMKVKLVPSKYKDMTIENGLYELTPFGKMFIKACVR